MREALREDTWIRDLAHGNNRHLLPDVLALHRLLQGADAQLQPGVPDNLTWSRASSGKYTARSAYLAQFQGRTVTPFDRLVWKAWAPGKIKIFAWLLLQDRLWCNNRLQRRGWTNTYFCQLCVRNLESSRHLFWSCQEAERVWAESRRHDSSTAIVQGILEQTPHQWRKGVWTLC